MFFIKPKAKFIYSLEVPDMHCGMCEAHIEDIIRKSAKIKKVTADRHKSLVTIYSDEPLDMELIKASITKTGYRVNNIKEEVKENG